MRGCGVVAHETARDRGLLLAWRDKKMLVFGWRVEHNLNKKEFSTSYIRCVWSTHIVGLDEDRSKTIFEHL